MIGLLALLTQSIYEMFDEKRSPFDNTNFIYVDEVKSIFEAFDISDDFFE